MLSDPVAEAFGLIHRHPSGENFWHGFVGGGAKNENLTVRAFQDNVARNHSVCLLVLLFVNLGTAFLKATFL